MTGKQVLAALVLIVLATAVLPPAAAWTVNRRRVARAQAEVSALANRLQARRVELDQARAQASVLCGSGRIPLAETTATEMWTRSPRASLALVLPGERLSPDPWGNCYVVNIGNAPGPEGPGLRVLSAGPNGTIETPFAGATALGGDDVGVVVSD